MTAASLVTPNASVGYKCSRAVTLAKKEEQGFCGEAFARRGGTWCGPLLREPSRFFARSAEDRSSDGRWTLAASRVQISGWSFPAPRAHVSAISKLPFVPLVDR